MSSKSGWHAFSGRTSCKFDGINEYHIGWQIPLQGVARANFAATVRSALDEPVASGPITFSFNRNPVDMQAHTIDSSGKLAQRSFHVGCFRNLRSPAVFHHLHEATSVTKRTSPVYDTEGR
jgi:hypothetical protein